MAQKKSAQKTQAGPTRKLPSRAALPLTERRAPVQDELPWMVVFKVLDTPHMIEFRVDKKIVLGRGIHDGFDLPYLDLTRYGAREAGVSRLHASLHVRNNCLSVKDLGSTNGTFLNGYQVQTYTDVPLQSHDVLELGQLRFQIVFVSRVASV